MTLNVDFPLNHKQQELAHHLFAAVQRRFPEIAFSSARLSPVDKESLWLYVSAPQDEDREIALREYAAELESDILQEYGYCITLKPRHGLQNIG